MPRYKWVEYKHRLSDLEIGDWSIEEGVLYYQKQKTRVPLGVGVNIVWLIMKKYQSPDLRLQITTREVLSKLVYPSKNLNSMRVLLLRSIQLLEEDFYCPFIYLRGNTLVWHG